MNNFTIDDDFVDASARGGKTDFPNGIVVIVEDLLRQTGGFCKVPSGRAVLDDDFPLVGHENSLLLR